MFAHNVESFAEIPACHICESTIAGDTHTLTAPPEDELEGLVLCDGCHRDRWHLTRDASFAVGDRLATVRKAACLIGSVYGHGAPHVLVEDLTSYIISLEKKERYFARWADAILAANSSLRDAREPATAES